MTIFITSSPFLWSSLARLTCNVTILQPQHREIYVMDPTMFFVPTFLKAINDNTEQSFRSILSEPAPGIFTFEMLQPHFCGLLLSEVFYHFNYLEIIKNNVPFFLQL